MKGCTPLCDRLPHATGPVWTQKALSVIFTKKLASRELMELSGMKMLPEQEVQAGGVHLWQLKRQANSVSNGFAIRAYSCLMSHMYKCNFGLRIVEVPDFMQLEWCGVHNKQSHITLP